MPRRVLVERGSQRVRCDVRIGRRRARRHGSTSTAPANIPGPAPRVRRIQPGALGADTEYRGSRGAQPRPDGVHSSADAPVQGSSGSCVASCVAGALRDGPTRADRGRPARRSARLRGAAFRRGVEDTASVHVRGAPREPGRRSGRGRAGPVATEPTLALGGGGRGGGGGGDGRRGRGEGTGCGAPARAGRAATARAARLA